MRKSLLLYGELEQSCSREVYAACCAMEEKKVVQYGSGWSINISIMLEH